MSTEDAQRTSDDQDQASPSRSEASPRTIQLPKGGGAIRGIGEKFAANPVTGTGSMSVPIATSPGRSGFGPQLSLSYDSGAGNGPFGFGWSLSLPSISRKTDKGLPKYQDAAESDVFVVSGAEDLVPVFRQDPDGAWIAAQRADLGFHRETDGWVLDASGRLVVHEDEFDGYRVRRYRPRIEGLFARIERWSKIGSQTDVHWRSISRGNILTLYGYDENSRIADPLDASRIFSWLICESRDDKGNGIRYLYKREDGAYQPRPGQADPFNQVHQRNRGLASDSRRTAQRYLQRVLYGNVKPLLDAQGRRPRYLSDVPDPPSDTDADWLFEVRFDYGELDERDPTGQPEESWLYRPDAFSSYRSGFEVRTCRRCERVLMLHHIPDQPAGPGRMAQPGYRGVARSTELTYDDEIAPTAATRPIYSFLKQVVQTGWAQEGGSTTRRSLPPVEFTYTEPNVQEVVEEVDPASLENLPVGLDGSAYRWTDLHGEGIPGILTEQAGTWYYKRNWSPIPQTQTDGSEAVKACFAPLETVAFKPNAALSASTEFMDLAGDGQPDVVVMEGPIPGLYEHDEAEGWQSFRPFTSRLNRNLGDPNLKFVDLDGDGHADVLVTEDDALIWHASLAEEGFGAARRVAQDLDEEKGPRIVFADGTQSIYLADMSGDGLTDLVRIRNSEICYWPNLGYCRFGAKVTMTFEDENGHTARFDHSDQFDHKRIRLADIDGSGTTDIIYLHCEGVRLYFNQSGNGWSQPQTLKVFPRIDDLVSIVPTDLLGNGTACLVWSSPLPGDSRRPMRYVNLMGDNKPHLLVKTINNLGAETRVKYAPSTKFYLQDKRDGKPWITRLPFPVHVVERVETWDHISRNHFVSRYAYHHGYFDGEEREFRGFGMVEQWDTEQFAALADGETPAANIDGASHVPPMLTRTWFHTGICRRRDRVSNYYAGLLNHSDRGEYYREPAWLDNDDEAKKRLLPDTILPPGLSAEEEREATRSLKGMMLRQEVYALDGLGVNADYPYGHPYTVAEQNFTVSPLQGRGQNRHAIFFTFAREAITYHYERDPKDPRIQHALTLEVDAYGNVLKQAAIGYGRLTPATDPAFTPADHLKQRLIHITSTENSFTNAITDKNDDYRTPLPAETRIYELRKPKQEQSGAVLALYGFNPVLGYIDQAGDGGHDVEYEDVEFNTARQAAADNDAENTKYFRRLIERVRMLYRPDDCGVAQNDPLALLPAEKLQALALPGESYKLAFTPGLVAKVFQRNGQPLLPDPGAVLGGTDRDRGGYVDLDGDGHWWTPSGRSFYHPNDVAAPVELSEARAHGYLPRRYRDPFGQTAVVDFDAHDLLMVETRDALGNRVTVEANNYRVLQPSLVSDPNRNQTEVAFDALGMVVGTAVMGKPTDNPRQGDRLDNQFSPEPPQALFDTFIDKPCEAAPDPNASVATQAAHDLLANATTRIVYDLTRYMRLGEPPFAATIARETHVSDLDWEAKSKLQIGFSFSDGFGREIQKKIQAEPGPLDVNDPASPTVNPRWVGSGWTIFNNKGKPVRQYEPFFSKRQRPDGSFYSDHRFEFGVQVGVSPVLFYDPAERVVATLHPNHTWEKVDFDPWQQTTFDVNDTVLLPVRADDPPRDAVVAGHFGRLPDADYLPTWHELRTLPAYAAAFADRYPVAEDRQNETKAAERAACHTGTPTTAHFDALGRPFLTVVRNRVVCDGHLLHNKPDEDFRTRVELDIEGNQRRVFDERKLPDAANLPLGAQEQRIVIQYAYDMLGNRIHQESMEAGARWMLSDVAGKPIRAWDSRGHNFTTTYDALRRPIEQYVRGTFSDPDPLKPNSDPRTLNPPNSAGLLVDRIEYGEPPPGATPAQEAEAQRLNRRTRIHRHCDSAGIVTKARLDDTGNPLEAYDFKGNQLGSTRQLVSDYAAIPDWSRDPRPKLDTETFEGRTRYDALNRPIQSVAPRSSLGRGKFNVIQPVFNEANLLERVHVWLERATEPAAVLNPANEAPSLIGVVNIDYNAKGQRTLIDYKTRDATVIRTTYAYDRETFRLTHLYTRRGVDPATAQGVAFTDDCDNPNPPPPATIAAPQTPVAGKRCGLQNLHYTYDPVGNITHIRDDAQQTIYFANQIVEPSNDYVYDALYRLIQAEGREHLGQAGAPMLHSYNDAGRVGILSSNPPGRFAPNDRNAMGRYTERYVYDAVGNFLQMQHARDNAAVPDWTRVYTYGEASLIEPGKQSNRLSSTTVGNAPPEPYRHDAHGNMLGMPQLHTMQWDYRDQLQMTQRQKVNEEDADGVARHGERTWCVYDASGLRVRKVTELANNGGIKDERIYLGGFELFRSYQGAAHARALKLERETLHLMDDKQRIALAEMRTLGDEQDVPRRLIRYQFGNHLGSSSLELDEQAQIISYEEYAPYGSSTYQAVRSQTEVAKRYRYTGKERDEESGLYYHGARYYGSWLGRWTSCDPLFAKDGLNLYMAYHANPVRFMDPTGTQNVGPKAPSKYGDIKNYDRQGIALRDASGKRTSEHEHILARINLWLQTYDEESRTSAYDKRDYRVSSTLTIPRDMALIKTGMDMALRDALKDAKARDSISPMLLRQTSVEAAIDRTIKARDAAIHARMAAGQSDVSDLKAITDDKIAAAAVYQMGQVFEAGKKQNTAEILLQGDTAARIEADINALGKSDSPSITPQEVLILIFVLSVIGSGGNRGDPPKYRVDVRYRVATDAEAGSKTPKVRVATPEQEQAEEEEVDREEEEKQEQKKREAKGRTRYTAEQVLVPAAALLAVGFGIFALTRSGNPQPLQQAFQR
ncbi:FG-GAP/YD repeat-containing protein [Caballeronia cordobensis]|uniref:FG-GAP/YD repeat-containing protein n=1 Tax=Caballeronia cordobensis TaxID=1353886 RepID=A0A158I6Z9_CABCO|nr:SpvB/TcaC N-terminal domain-containing protein [Caballeronia cordobensis]SAL52365.1 FG-GAP/YD repeat-containing protein [Caballeronia cordobensis]